MSASMIRGIRIGTAAAGIRYKNRDDMVVFELPENSVTAATFTKNRFAAAPVIVAKQYLAETMPRYILINAGNANAGTGERGIQDASASCSSLARATHTDNNQTLPFSTGVIGEYLPMNKVESGIHIALEDLQADNWQKASKAIMTTDTRAKLVTEEFSYNGQLCHITGISKGSGMIHPNMATMLAFVATDAGISQNALQGATSHAVNMSFNRITVDGDTSTNDACVVSATGQSECHFADDDETGLLVFREKLTRVCQQLAELIVRDGEGITKFTRIRVEAGLDESSCHTIANTVALSPLVKTALYGKDPNWGRILAAIGRAPVADFDLSKIDIYLDDVCIVRNGERDEWYREEDGQSVMQGNELTIRIVMNQGDATVEVLTSDLSHEYVNINADYRS